MCSYASTTATTFVITTILNTIGILLITATNFLLIMTVKAIATTEMIINTLFGIKLKIKI